MLLLPYMTYICRKRAIAFGSSYLYFWNNGVDFGPVIYEFQLKLQLYLTALLKGVGTVARNFYPFRSKILPGPHTHYTQTINRLTPRKKKSAKPVWPV